MLAIFEANFSLTASVTDSPWQQDFTKKLYVTYWKIFELEEYFVKFGVSNSTNGLSIEYYHKRFRQPVR